MTIGVSSFFIAVGAILTFAVTTEAEGISIDVVGWILMILGTVGLVLSLIMFDERQRSGNFEDVRSRHREHS